MNAKFCESCKATTNHRVSYSANNLYYANACTVCGQGDIKRNPNPGTVRKVNAFGNEYSEPAGE